MNENDQLWVKWDKRIQRRQIPAGVRVRHEWTTGKKESQLYVRSDDLPDPDAEAIALMADEIRSLYLDSRKRGGYEVTYEAMARAALSAYREANGQ